MPFSDFTIFGGNGRPYYTAPGVANSQCYFGLDAPKDASGLDAQCVYAFLGIWYKYLLTSLFSLTDCNRPTLENGLQGAENRLYNYTR
jgi:hypothetical protein